MRFLPEATRTPLAPEIRISAPCWIHEGKAVDFIQPIMPNPQKPTTLTTNGLTAPPGFPTEAYEAVHRAVTSTRSLDGLYDHYAGAWNAVVYRFNAMVDSGEVFTASVDTYGSTPEPQERYFQEKALFEFFSAAFAVFEASLYGLHAIAAFIDSAAFPTASPQEQRQVTPLLVKKRLERRFPADQVVVVVTTLLADPGYLRLQEIRNILTHRSAPGRRIYVSIGSENAPPVEWKLNNIQLNQTLITDAIADVGRLSSGLLSGVATFAAEHLIGS